MNLAIKYRPIVFEQILGQNLAVQIAKASLVAPKLHPTYLLVGPSGSGKTTLARIMARRFNCTGSPQDYPNPCNECSNCTSHLKNKNPDIIEIDAADKTGVDDVRQIIEQCKLHTITGYIRVYIIDEFHQMSSSAQNAMLKLLEEPPSNTVFLLCTTEEDKIIETIKTRARLLRFTKPEPDLLVPFLVNVASAENIALTKPEAELIYRHNNGSVRKCLQTLGSIVPNVSVAQLCPQIDSSMVSSLLLAISNLDYLQLNAIVQEVDRKGFYPKGLLIELIDLVVEMMPQRDRLFAKKANAILNILVPVASKLGKNGLANCRLALYEAALAWQQEPGTVDLEPVTAPQPTPQPVPNPIPQPVPHWEQERVQPVPQPVPQPVQPQPQVAPAPNQMPQSQPMPQHQPVQQPPYWDRGQVQPMPQPMPNQMPQSQPVQQPQPTPLPQPVQQPPQDRGQIPYWEQGMQPVQQPVRQPVPQPMPQLVPQPVPNSSQNDWYRYN